MKQRDDDLRGKLVCRQVAGQVGVSKKGSPGGLLLVMVMVVGERKSCPDRRARMAPFPAATPRQADQGRQTNAAKCRLTHSLRNYNYRVPPPRGFVVASWFVPYVWGCVRFGMIDIRFLLFFFKGCGISFELERHKGNRYKVVDVGKLLSYSRLLIC